MDKETFEQSEAVQYWMDSLPGKDGYHTTKYQWRHNLLKFCEWADKTPDELIAERKEEAKSEDGKVQHRKEMLVKKYLKHLEEERQLAPNTRRTYFTAIRSFFQRNYLSLTFMRREGPPLMRIQEGSRAATKQEIRKMCTVSNPRIRSLILFIKDSGLAESDVAKMKIGDLGVKTFEEMETLKAPVPIMVRRKKTNVLTMTFISSEALEALKTTFEMRMCGSPEIKIRRYGMHEIKGGISPETLTVESPLFRSYGKFLYTLKGKGEIGHLTPHAISVLIRKAAISAGVWCRGFSAHALRRYFQTTLETVGINGNWIKIMMGHKLPGPEDAYSRPTVEMLMEAYKKAMGALSITETAEQRTRVEMLETQVQNLLLNGQQKDAKIQNLENSYKQAYDKDMVSLRKEVNELRKLVQTYMKDEEGSRKIPQPKIVTAAIKKAFRDMGKKAGQKIEKT